MYVMDGWLAGWLAGWREGGRDGWMCVHACTCVGMIAFLHVCGYVCMYVRTDLDMYATQCDATVT